ncbi:four helix bundle protein [Myroides sp. 1354]|uniref:four helix bundle protein n=1 Tax=unclassified Myroides TaxID=2642485 RepID=UPI00257808BA|nr:MULTISPECIES: four helix bundle protein [unclassified Myroides]MDM1044982.1 four helix bundle protein [Myroides sp. R163-1]MDM1055695.1 four helix bundle protein [Myroides sp. 1354]MDM1068992.1 four helix bundle protein [Myroides sp. 1372]
MHIYSFEKLTVWQNARNTTKTIYLLTRKFPEEEKFGLVSQLRRAMTSVTANIAEGISRSTSKDKHRMLNISYSSAIEVINFLILCLDLELITEEEYLDLRKKLEHITNQLYSLCRKLKD